jgi:hypothetical protein
MFRIFVSFIALLCLATSSFSEEKKEVKEVKQAQAWVVEGLQLPADQKVNWDEGFITIQAQCKGEVKWLPISEAKIKFIALPGNSIIVSVPPQGGTVTLFAVGVIDGKATEFARTNIVVNAPGPQPGPSPQPQPQPTNAYHVTFLTDLNKATPQVAAVLNSPTLAQSIRAKGAIPHIYDLRDPIVAQKNLSSVVQKVGGNAVMVIQRPDGTVVRASVIPATEQDVLQAVSSAVGK